MPSPSSPALEAVRSRLGSYAPTLAVELYGSLASTNTLAKEFPDRNTPALIIAREQTGGRGRLGRSFHSPAGTGLYMTVAYTTSRPLGEAVRVTAAAAVAAAAAIEALTDKHPSVKWVNDLYLRGGKLGGILTEAVTRADGLHRMVVGLGINLTTAAFPPGLRAPAASLFSPEESHLAEGYFTERLAGEIARRLLELAEGSDRGDFPGGMWGEACLDFYRRRLLYVGQRVICTRGSEVFEGTVLGVDGDYSLLLEREGNTVALSSGEISVRPTEKI